jgi:predicted metalloprotease with PDZ domain
VARRGEARLPLACGLLALTALPALLGLFAACSPDHAQPRGERDPDPARPLGETKADPAPDEKDPPAWIYQVAASRGGAELAVEATFADSGEHELTVGPEARPYVGGVETQGPEGWIPLESDQGVWTLASSAGKIHVRYRVDLARAASRRDDFRIARKTENAIESPPSTWLLRPPRAPEGTRFRFQVICEPGDSFATGVYPAPGGRNTYEGDAEDMGMLPFAAFGSLRVRAVEGDDVSLVLLPGRLDAEEDVVAWVRDAARAVRGFYGKLPVRRIVVFVRPVRGSRIGYGTTMGGSGAGIAIDVGARATRSRFADDWILVHEMTHTALPDLGMTHHWLEEGLATYVEPLARVRAGLLPLERLWKDWIENMPKGEPEEGDQGLDRTHTWGRTYWGGALFCLVADLAIRERTGGKKSLRDALLGVQAAGGDISVSWPIERVIEFGDLSTGVPVLRETYDRMKATPVDVDLPSIWKRLGVTAEGDRVSFDEQAPQASMRDAMTR